MGLEGHKKVALALWKALDFPQNLGLSSIGGVRLSVCMVVYHDGLSLRVMQKYLHERADDKHVQCNVLMISKDFRFTFFGGISADGAVCKHSRFASQVVSDP